MADLLPLLQPSSATTNNPDQTDPSLVTLKAGACQALLQPSGMYKITPQEGRMQIEIRASGTNGVRFVHRDRRGKKTVKQDLAIFKEDNVTFSRVDTGKPEDRVYLLQFGRATDQRFFFWLQDIDQSKDAELTRKIAQYVKNPPSTTSNETLDFSAPSSSGATNGNIGASSTGADQAALMNAMGLNTSASSDVSTSAGDALSNILSGLSSSVQEGSSLAPVASSGTQNTITLQDLQGAMASLATQSPSTSATAGPPLDEFANTNIIEESGILNNEAIKNRLMELLPEGQQTEEGLQENLTSPQVKATLRSLSQAIASESFNSVIANFQLDPQDGAVSLMTGNPIQAFLDCVLKHVEREKENKKDDAGGADAMDESKDEESKEGQD